MRNTLMIDRVTRGGLYAELIDVCEHLASGDYSSASNALYVLAKQSPLYQKAVKDIRRKRRGTRLAPGGIESHGEL